MFIKNINDCEEFTANDGCRIRELLHPANDPVELSYSIAVARVDAGRQSYMHKLQQGEVYCILQGKGEMHIENEVELVSTGDLIVIPANSVQWIKNVGEGELIFTAIVNPPWTQEGDMRLNGE